MPSIEPRRIRPVVLASSTEEASAIVGLLGTPPAAIPVTTLPEALSELSAGRADVLLCTSVLTGTTGYEACSELRTGPAAGVPVILVGTPTRPVDPVRAAASGADGFLDPPLDPQSLRDEVLRVTAPGSPPRGGVEAVLAAAARELSRARERERSVLARLEHEAGARTRVQRELDEFTSVASHDLQEPLRMVVSYLGLLERRYAGQLDADAREFIEFAVDGARRLGRMLQDLLTYARVSTRGRAPAPVDLGDVLERVLSGMSRELAASDARVDADPLPRVQGDPDQLAEVFRVILTNALVYRGEEAPRIGIRAERSGPWWEISASDNGIGFEMRHAEAIFKLFHRLHGREQRPGTGMGLAIARRIVERHGGTIRAESTPGRGSVFRFTLPA